MAIDDFEAFRRILTSLGRLTLKMLNVWLFFSGFGNPNFELPDNLSDSPKFEGVKGMSGENDS